jgi:hypothetical protein
MSMSLLFLADFNSTKNMERGKFVLFCFIFKMLVTVCPRFSISVMISSVVCVCVCVCVYAVRGNVQLVSDAGSSNPPPRWENDQ